MLSSLLFYFFKRNCSRSFHNVSSILDFRLCFVLSLLAVQFSRTAAPPLGLYLACGGLSFYHIFPLLSSLFQNFFQKVFPPRFPGASLAWATRLLYHARVALSRPFLKIFSLPSGASSPPLRRSDIIACYILIVKGNLSKNVIFALCPRLCNWYPPFLAKISTVFFFFSPTTLDFSNNSCYNVCVQRNLPTTSAAILPFSVRPRSKVDITSPS